MYIEWDEGGKFPYLNQTIARILKLKLFKRRNFI